MPRGYRSGGDRVTSSGDFRNPIEEQQYRIDFDEEGSDLDRGPSGRTVGEFVVDAPRYHMNDPQYDSEAAPYDSDGRRYDSDGRRYDSDGRRFDSDGRRYDSDGRRYDSDGRRYDSDGRRYDSDGRRYDSDGRRYDSDGRRYDSDGRRYDSDGRRYDDRARAMTPPGETDVETQSAIYAEARSAGPRSDLSHYATSQRTQKSGYSDDSSVKTKTSRHGNLMVETMSAPHPCCPNTKGVCCLMLLLNLALILIALGFVIVLQLFHPPFVWYIGLALLVVGFFALIFCLVYCVWVCRDAHSEQHGDGQLYWTHHWQKQWGYKPDNKH